MSRLATDACPGVLRPHQAADGALVRLRLPGGTLSPHQLRGLIRLSGTHADGNIGLTSRANLQLRGLPGEAVPLALESGIAALGLLPSPTHERVRNVLASPLTGIRGGMLDVRPVVAAIDRAVCARPDLARLPGRFLVTVDDGRGDVIGLRCDIGVLALDAHRAQLLVGERVTGPVVGWSQVPGAVADLCRAFLGQRGGHWHVRELPHGGAELLPARGPAPRVSEASRTPIGVLGRDDGRPALSVLVPLGRLTAAQAEAVAAASAGDVVVTPWRGLVLSTLASEPAQTQRTLEHVGLVASAPSAWVGVTACVGAPRCHRAGVDTAAIAGRLVEAAHPRETLLPVHVSACERRCGAPSGRHVDLVAGDTATITLGSDHGTSTAAQLPAAVNEMRSRA